MSREWVLVSVGTKRQLGSPERLIEKLRKIGQHSTPTNTERATADIEGARRVGDTSPESRILRERITVLERRVQESERRSERRRQEADGRVEEADGRSEEAERGRQEAEGRVQEAERGRQEAEGRVQEAEGRVQEAEARQECNLSGW